MEKRKIVKLIYTADSIETARGWSLAHKDNPLLCDECKSPIFYIQINWGVVDEEPLLGIKVIGKPREPQYSIREVGFNIYCAECANFIEHYDKYFYPKDKVVCYWRDELDLAEIEEIRHCLEQFNRKGDFTPNYRSMEIEFLRGSLKEYESKNGFNNEKRRTREKIRKKNNK